VLELLRYPVTESGRAQSATAALDLGTVVPRASLRQKKNVRFLDSQTSYPRSENRKCKSERQL